MRFPNPVFATHELFGKERWIPAEPAKHSIALAADGAWPPADKPVRRYFSGKNTTQWQATQVSADAPADWTVVTFDLWKDFGEFTLTGIAPTALGGPAMFDRIELLHTLNLGVR